MFSKSPPLGAAVKENKKTTLYAEAVFSENVKLGEFKDFLLQMFVVWIIQDRFFGEQCIYFRKGKACTQRSHKCQVTHSVLCRTSADLFSKSCLIDHPNARAVNVFRSLNIWLIWVKVLLLAVITGHI